jgi:hypothetical protein
MSQFLDDYEIATSFPTITEACEWMQRRVRKFLADWQHEGLGYDGARQLICIQLAYIARLRGPDDERLVYRLYGAIHPLVLFMTKEERKGRQFPHEFTEAELRQAADRWVFQSPIHEGVLA